MAGLARACHPEPTVAVTAVMVLLAANAGRGASGTLAVGVAVFAGQLSVGWSNDYVDADRDRAAARFAKPIVRGSIGRDADGAAALVALAFAVGLSFLSGWPAALAHLAGVGAAWLYNLGVKSTVASFVPYAVAFGLLPGFVTWGLPGHPAPPAWLLATGALLGVGAHFANVLPDLAADAATGVRGLPQRLGVRGSGAAAVVALVVASAVLLLGSDGFSWPVAAGVLTAFAAANLAAVAWATRHPASPVMFRLSMAIALADVVLLVASGHLLR